MANGTHKTRILNRLLNAVKHNGHPDGTSRPVLEQVIFGILRDGTTTAQAERAFHALQTSFFDWNEIRVSMVREVADVLADLPEPEDRAARIISFLQDVFETTYSFDLESLHKKGLKMAEKQLQRFQGVTPFALAYAMQTSLGGHALPVDRPMARVLRRLELINGEYDESARTSLEHLVPKAKGVQFCEALSAIAHDYCYESDPKCPACPVREACPTAKANLAAKARNPASKAKSR